MKVLITGANGQLGREIQALVPSYPQHTFFFTGKEDLDVTQKEAVGAYVVDHQIQAIVNCAAYTAVDKAESEPELADKINHLAVKYLGEVADAHNIYLIHISTDYVFDGKGYRPYSTDHPTNPVNMYGKTKLKGEKALQALDLNKSMVIRTSWVYSSFGHNFVKTMLRLGKEKETLNVIDDQVGVPTYARDLAEFILDYALAAQHRGLKFYHFTNEGVCSWYDFAREIMRLGHLNCKVLPIPSAAYSTPANRPFYALMDKTSLKKDFNTEIPYWKDSLKKCLEKMKDS